MLGDADRAATVLGPHLPLRHAFYKSSHAFRAQATRSLRAYRIKASPGSGSSAAARRGQSSARLQIAALLACPTQGILASATGARAYPPCHDAGTRPDIRGSAAVSTIET